VAGRFRSCHVAESRSRCGSASWTTTPPLWVTCDPSLVSFDQLLATFFKHPAQREQQQRTFNTHKLALLLVKLHPVRR
jgi:hypothetical protein